MNEATKKKIEKAPINVLKIFKEFLAMNQKESLEWAEWYGFTKEDFQKDNKKIFKTSRVKHVILDHLIEENK